MTRCINIDWLEYYCLEDPAQPHTPEYYRACGEWVVEREYGTPNYNQMFVIMDAFGSKMIEIRRDPKSKTGINTVLPANACHIRLTNRFCYSDNAIKTMNDFCAKHNLEISRISRIDICMDFEKFDSNDDPLKFIQRYLRHKYAKFHQSEGGGHFSEDWTKGMTWNYLCWGSGKSPVTTKLYLKTLDLEEKKDKPYIKEAWFRAGLVDDPVQCIKRKTDGTTYKPQIWRLEFAIKSKVKNWVTIRTDGKKNKYQSYRNTPDLYDTRDKIKAMFASLCHHYFEFVKYSHNKSKYECKPKILFNFETQEFYYSVEHPSTDLQQDTEEQRLRKYLMRYRGMHSEEHLRDCIDYIVQNIDSDNASRFTSNPLNKTLLKALQMAIAERLEGSTTDPAKLITHIVDIIKNSNEPIL